MKNLAPEFLLFLTLIILIHSCEYEPVGTYELKVNKDADPPNIQVVELNLNNDSIIVYNESTVKFKFDTQYNNVQTVKLLIDDIEIGTLNSNKGEFIINSLSLLPVGIHEIVIRIITGSGTGSIAESVGAEGYVFSKSWKLIVKKWYEHDLDSFIADGLLHITWPEYDASDFKEYLIYRFDYLYNEVEIGRTKTTEFIDSTYAGEGAQYIVKVKNQDEKVYPLAYPIIYPDLPELTFSADSLNQYIVTWSKSKFYNAIDSYLVFIGYEYEKYRWAKSTHDLGDTTYIANDSYFGDNLFVRLRITPKRVNIQYAPSSFSRFEKMLSASSGYSFRIKNYLNDLYPVNEDEFVYIMGCDSVVRYSLSKKRILEEVGHNTPDVLCCEFVSLSASPSGNYVTARIGCYSNLMFTSSSPMNPYIEINQRYITGNADNNNIPVSDIGTGILTDNDMNLSIYDFKNSKILETYTRSSSYPLYPGSLKLSGNGDYFIVIDDSLRLIHFSNNEFQPVSFFKKPGDKMLIEFDEVNPEQLIFWDGSQLSVKRCDSFSTVYEFPLTEALLDIDYRNNEILCFSPGHLNVRSLMDGTLVKDVPINFIPSWGKTCYLINNTIIYTAGLMYFIN